jgi:purine nucleosidase
MRIIFDTDIGTDVDDCLALALVLGSPEIRLEAVTCVYGDVVLRSRIVAQQLALHGTTGVPIALGARETLMRQRAIYWEGHEGVGLLHPDERPAGVVDEHAVDLIVRTVLAHPGEITILAIGPLTNIALALSREPRIAQAAAGFVLMGGVARGPATLSLPVAEHNIVCDPEAAAIVFASGAPIRLVPLDVTTRVSIRQADVARLRARHTPYHDAVAGQVERYPRFQRQGQTDLHDPLAAAALLRPDLLTFQPLYVQVETAGRLTSGMTVMRAPSQKHPASAEVARDVAVAAAEGWIIERIAAPLGGGQ